MASPREYCFTRQRPDGIDVILARSYTSGREPRNETPPVLASMQVRAATLISPPGVRFAMAQVTAISSSCPDKRNFRPVIKVQR